MALSSSSSHPPHIHMNWPRSRIKTFGKLCASRDDFKKAQALLVDSIRRSSPRHPALAETIAATFHTSCSQIRHIPCLPPTSIAWIVMPYHDSIGKAGLGKALHVLWQKWEPLLVSSGLDAGSLMPRISWKLGGTKLIQELLSYNFVDGNKNLGGERG